MGCPVVRTILPALFEINEDRRALIDDPGSRGRVFRIVALSHIHDTVFSGPVIKAVPFHPGTFLKDTILVKLVILLIDRRKLSDTDAVLVQVIALIPVGDPARPLLARGGIVIPFSLNFPPAALKALNPAAVLADKLLTDPLIGDKRAVLSHITVLPDPTACNHPASALKIIVFSLVEEPPVFQKGTIFFLEIIGMGTDLLQSLHPGSLHIINGASGLASPSVLFRRHGMVGKEEAESQSCQHQLFLHSLFPHFFISSVVS